MLGTQVEARRAVRVGAYLFGAYLALQSAWSAPAGVILQGVLIGGIGALLALGLALVYRANRIVNFAQADLGGVPAIVTVLTVQAWGWPLWVSMAFGLVVAVATGALVQRLFIHRFFAAPRLILTVVTIGISQLLIAATVLLPRLFLDDPPRVQDPPAPFSATFSLHPIVFGGWDVFAFITVPLIILGLFAFLRYTSVGIAIRASAENAERAALLGVPIGRVQAVVWVLAAVLSYWGVLLRIGSIGALGLFSITGSGPALLMRALAAAVIGRMERFGIILAASVGLGVLEQAIVWDTGRASHAIAVEFMILLAALWFQRRRSERVDPAETSSWQAATSARPVPREVAALPEVRTARRILLWVAVAVVLLVPLVLDDGKTSLAALVFVYALLGLSVVVLTGWAGQVSLGQAAFFGFGGAVGAALTVRSWDPGVSLIVAGLVGATAATVVGLPALRVKGLYLAVTTLAFSVFASSYLINPDTVHWVPVPSTFIERRELFGRISIASEQAYYFFCVACFAIGLALVRGFRHSRTGRALVGLRDNERAAQSFGINATRTKLTAFALSGFLAAVAGVLYTHSQQAVSLGRFTPEESLRVFTMVVIGGVGTIPGALVGSLYLNGIQWFGGTIGTEWLRTLVAFLGTGMGLIVILLVLPGGLGDMLYRARDALLRGVAARRGLAVPSFAPDADAAPSPVAMGEPAEDGAGALVLRGVDVGYDGIQVLFGLDLHVRQGEIVALLGTNGAGKSTALRAVSGLTPATSGTVRFDGIDLTSLAPHRVLAHGIAQCPGGRGVFPGLTVRENLRIATWPYRRDRDAADRAINDAFARFPVLEDRANVVAGALSGGQQQMLTLAQTFMTRPRLVMIDELSLGLAPVVVAQLTDVVRRMRDEGTTIVLVEQSVNVALTVADRAYFMEKGQVRFEGPTAELLDRPDLLRSVFVGGAGNGPHVAKRSKARRKAPDRMALEVQGLRRRFGAITAVDDVSFGVEPGQVLGVIGPNGAGKTTLFDLISGFADAETGRVLIDGIDVTELGPDVRVRAGLGRSFQDARLFAGLTVPESIALAFEREVEVKDPLAAALNMPAVARAERVIAARVDELIELLGLGDYRDKFVGELSTGTRRVVDLACALAHRPKVLLFDEPSSGLAQRETEALAPLITRLQRETGAAIVVIEHDMPLISAVSDELMAMHLGTVLARGRPADVLGDPRVIETYLGTREDIIHRSGNHKARVRV